MTGTGLLDRATTATDARGGRQLFAYRSSSDLVDRIELAKGGSVRVGGVPIFKEGSFHGGAFTVDAIEIEAMVSRFGQLYPDVFVPPVRVDHGWSARDVIGWIEGLSTAVLADPSDGGREKTYLLADLELVDLDAVEQIRSRKLRNRSSEIGGYETNGGAVYPLIVWGVAFVDIPAVEGLGDVKLRAGEPATVIDLGSEGASMGPDDTTPTDEPVEEPTDTPDAPPADVEDDSQVPPVETAPPATEEPVRQDLGEDVVGPVGSSGNGDTPDDESGDGEDVDTSEGTEAGDAETPAEPSGEGGTPDTVEQLATLPSEQRIARLRELGFTAEADELEGLRTERIRLRTERVETELRTFGERGVVVPANREHARTLLSHESEPVRLAAIALLESFRPPVQLGELEVADRPGGTTKSGLTPGMSKAEGGALWASLTTEQRKDPEIVAEYDVWREALPRDE